MGIRDRFKRDLRGIQGDEEKGFFSNSLLGKDKRVSHFAKMIEGEFEGI